MGNFFGALFDVFTYVGSWIGGIVRAIFGSAQGREVLRDLPGNPIFPDSEAYWASISGTWNGLLPLIGIAVAISVIFFAIKLIKKISWGY